MGDTLQLTDGTNTIEIRRPDFGYSTAVNMRLHYANTIGSDIWDDGASYDSRQCRIKQWLMTKTEHDDLMEFLNNIDKGRGNSITLKLGSTSTGFFPFGADYGDKGDFSIRVPTIDYKEGKHLYDPLHWWENDLMFCLVPGSTLPSYTPPAAENEGEMEIGTVAHLLCPQTPPSPLHIRGLNSSITNNGTVDFFESGVDSDSWETDIPIEMRTGNCAALIKFLTGAEGRGNLFGFVPPLNLFPFGYHEYGEFSYFDVYLLTNKIEIAHVNYEKFLTTIRLKYSGVPV
jgi:hypothetical protein